MYDTKLSARILVVDDDPDDLELLRELFVQNGMDGQVGYFSNVQSLTEHLDSLPKEGLPALILTDLNMPGRTGLDLLQTLAHQKLLRHMDVIILTTSSHASDRAKCLMAGAKDYLIKPDKVGEFRELVAGLKSYV